MEKGAGVLGGGEQSDIGRLYRRLVVVALVSMTIIVVVAGSFGIYRVYRHYVLQRAGENATHITEVLHADRRELFLAGGRIAVEPRDRLALDQSLRSFLHPFTISSR